MVCFWDLSPRPCERAGWKLTSSSHCQHLPQMGFLQIRGTFRGIPTKRRIVVGSILGSLYLGNLPNGFLSSLPVKNY